MDCQFINENLISYLEGALIPDDLDKFKAHLAQCDSCKRLVQEVGKTYLLAEKPADFSVNEDFAEQTLARWQQGESRLVPLYRVLKPIAVAASIGLGILIGNGELSILNSNNNSTQDEALVMSVSAPTEYSVWQTFEEDYGSEN